MNIEHTSRSDRLATPPAWRASAAVPAAGGRRRFVRDGAARNRKPRNTAAPRAEPLLPSASRCEDTLDLFPRGPAQAQPEPAGPGQGGVERPDAAGRVMDEEQLRAAIEDAAPAPDLPPSAGRSRRPARQARQTPAAISTIPSVGPRSRDGASLPAVIPFQFESHAVRVQVDGNGQPWFVAADVCAALGLPDTHKAVARLDDDEKGRNSIPTLGGAQDMSVVNEPGLYGLVLGSRKPEAKRFKRWVTHEVLPAIRKTGTYAVPAVAAVPAAPIQDRVVSLLLIGEALAKVPGVHPGIAMAAMLTCIHENTGLAVETLRRSLPASVEPICTINATHLGKLLGLSAAVTNQLLARRGLQFRNARDEWELSRAGESWAEALPYSRNGHSGYQILWNPHVAQLLNDAG